MTEYYKKYIYMNGFKVDGYILKLEYNTTTEDCFYFTVVKTLNSMCAYKKGEMQSNSREDMNRLCIPISEEELMLELL